jgi:hypothetical protein
MADQDETDERHKLFEDINARWQGDKPNRWIDLSQAVDLVANALAVQPAKAGASLLSGAIPPAVPWAAFTMYPELDDEAGRPIEIEERLLINASFDFRQGLIWIDEGGFRLEDIYIEQNRLEVWLEKERRDELVRFARKAINVGLRGDKPNRWIELYKAVKLIKETLGMLPGPAQELLQKEAIPPAVPWVGEVSRTWSDGTTFLMPIEIRRAQVTGADIHVGAGSMRSGVPDESIIFEIHVELNHLEAWLEKRTAPVVQPVPSAPANMAPKNKAEGSMAEWDDRKREEEIQRGWRLINFGIQGDKPNRWIKPALAGRIIAERLDMPTGPARELLLKEALPPAVPWVGSEIVRPNAGRGPLYMPREIGLAELRKADVDLFSRSRLMSPEYSGDWILDICIEQNHLEAWLEKRKAPAVQPVPSSPKGRPGPKPIAKRDREIRRRLAAGELPDGNKRWAHEIRTACGATEGARGYSDERIAKVTRRLQEQIARRSN